MMAWDDWVRHRFSRLALIDRGGECFAVSIFNYFIKYNE